MRVGGGGQGECDLYGAHVCREGKGWMWCVTSVIACATAAPRHVSWSAMYPYDVPPAKLGGMGGNISGSVRLGGLACWSACLGCHAGTAAAAAAVLWLSWCCEQSGRQVAGPEPNTPASP